MHYIQCDRSRLIYRTNIKNHLFLVQEVKCSRPEPHSLDTLLYENTAIRMAYSNGNTLLTANTFAIVVLSTTTHL